ncbi:RagB/SusD family nutrient uptake outer membrane protein [Pedobacter sp. P351]|uniref:RagB/SusD family nutrient uptake outer membrane protein n=1 Tax=Pedobacter superstes TaxID=3133441 RepID=UPI00309F5052
MIKNIIYKITIVLFIISSSSCNKWLELEPQDGLIRQEYWKTKEQVESAVLGSYVYMAENSVVNQLWRWSEIRGDMISLPLSFSLEAEEYDLIQGNILPTNKFAKWNNIYKVINNCNLVIDFAPQTVKEDPSFEILELNEKLAEVKAIRALMYFYLLRTYGEVPLQLTGISEDTQIKKLGKSSESDIMNQILADLEFAKSNAPESYENVASDKGRITKWAAYAILADVNLWKGDYPAVVEACEAIQNSSRFGLIQAERNSGDFFHQLYFQGNSAESIFELQYTEGMPNMFYSMFSASSKDYIANAETMDEIFPPDDLDPAAFDLRGPGVAFHPINFSIWKYGGANGNVELDELELRSQDASVANYILYRYADVLLMKAEALAIITGSEMEVVSIINRIRSRAKALSSTQRQVDASSSSAELLDYILEERQREFAFEGKRWFDILRFARRDESYKARLIEVATTNIPDVAKRTAEARLQDKNSWFFPVPQSELLADKTLTQNPFYR